MKCKDCKTEYDLPSYCPNCFGKCDLCPREINLDNDNFTFDGGPDVLCSSCFEENFFQCSNCGQTLSNDHYGEEGECENCASLEANYFDNPSTPIPSITFKDNPFSRKFGVELESSSGYIHKRSTRFSAVQDGSISGAEYVSPPMQGDAGLEEIKRLCAEELEVDKKCGFHLHIDATDLNANTVSRIARNFKILEPIMFQLVAQSRRHNSYCYPIKTNYENAKNEPTLKMELYGDRDFEIQDKWHDKRYEWLNLHSYFVRGTVELRLHHGTFNFERIKSWILLNLELFELFMDTEFDDPQAIISSLSSRGKEIIIDRLKRYSDGNLAAIKSFLSFLEREAA